MAINPSRPGVSRRIKLVALVLAGLAASAAVWPAAAADLTFGQARGKTPVPIFQFAKPSIQVGVPGLPDLSPKAAEQEQPPAPAPAPRPLVKVGEASGATFAPAAPAAVQVAPAGARVAPAAAAPAVAAAPLPEPTIPPAKALADAPPSSGAGGDVEHSADVVAAPPGAETGKSPGDGQAEVARQVPPVAERPPVTGSPAPLYRPERSDGWNGAGVIVGALLIGVLGCVAAVAWLLRRRLRGLAVRLGAASRAGRLNDGGSSTAETDECRAAVGGQALPPAVCVAPMLAGQEPAWLNATHRNAMAAIRRRASAADAA